MLDALLNIPNEVTIGAVIFADIVVAILVVKIIKRTS